MENNSVLSKEEEEMELPPGFRFYPTDEELITHYLSQKVIDNCFCCRAIGEVDLNKCEPWDLPRKAKMGEKEWYFFCVRDKKYPTGMRTNRATDVGYWKATGKDREIHKGRSLVGKKKTLVFYKGRAPRGEKTNWVMHEYRLDGKYSTKYLPETAYKDWVICRVFRKSADGKKTQIYGLRPSVLPLLTDSSTNNNETVKSADDKSHVTCFSVLMEDHKPIETSTFVNSLNTSLLASPSPSNIASAASILFPRASLPSIANFQYDYSLFMPEQSILRMLLETHNPNMGQNSGIELSPSQETGFTNHMPSVVTSNKLIQSSFEDEEDLPPCTTGPVDLGCIWDY